MEVVNNFVQTMTYLHWSFYIIDMSDSQTRNQPYYYYSATVGGEIWWLPQSLKTFAIPSRKID